MVAASWRKAVQSITVNREGGTSMTHALERTEQAELEQDEMLAILRERVNDLYGLTLDEYIEARKAGTLPRLPGSAALEVFSGEAASPHS